jgi:hypothetical protein
VLFEIPQSAVRILYVVVEKNQPLYIDIFKKIFSLDRMVSIGFNRHLGAAFRDGQTTI